jgi:hypothetical protein
MAAPIAAIAEAQAASTTKLGPWRSNRLANRPAMMLASSPGMVSSVISGRRWPTPACSSPAIAERTAAGRAAKLGAAASSWATSGNDRRRAVM